MSQNSAIEKNKNCTKWGINTESSNIQSGTPSIDQAYSVNMISIGLWLKRDGFIQFKYKKDRILDDVYSNGNLAFYVDYDLKMWDTEDNVIWIERIFNLTKGYHNFLWRYVYFVDKSKPASLNLNAYIDYIKIDGVEYADTTCKQCVNKFSEAGSDSCIFCGYNYFFNEQIVYRL